MIPLGTDVPQRRTPWANRVIIGLNLVIFVLSAISGEFDKITNWMAFRIDQPTMTGFFTCIFAHGGVWHIAGNMLFLWVFGHAVNDKMGDVAYTLFYLASGLAATLGFALVATPGASVIGASGAVAAVTAAFVVLFPLANVKVLYFFIIIGILQMPAMWLVAINIVVFNIILTTEGVAYQAHLAGYAFGFVAGFVLLATRGVSRDNFDLFALWNRYQRRKGIGPVYGGGPTKPQSRVYMEQTATDNDGGVPVARPVKAEPANPRQPEIDAARLKIERALREHDYETAVTQYLHLIDELDNDHVLPRNQQLEVANTLMESQRYEKAVEAYKKYAQKYPRGDRIQEVELITGLVLGRYLDRPGEAVDWVKRAKPRLRTENHKAMAEQLLAEIENKLRGQRPATG